jgi:NADPH-dependent ferric siderophore reductase
VSWLHRLGAPAGDPAALVAEASEVELPPGRGHAYLLGEARVVLALREVLSRRGLRPDQMSPKAYWGRGRANAGHGEPPRES